MAEEVVGEDYDAYTAAALGDVILLEKLIRIENVNARNEGGWTPLLYASFYDQTDCVRYLVQSGADVCSLSKKRKSAMTMAAINGNMDIITLVFHKSLVDNKDDDDCTDLFYATEHGRVDVVECLLSRGANPDILCGGRTPLMLAGARGDLRIVRCLLGGGADVTIVGEELRTAKQYAMDNGHIEVFNYIDAYENRDFKSILTINGLEKYVNIFEKNGITFEKFLELTEDAMKELGIKTFGPRRKLKLLIEEVKSVYSAQIQHDQSVNKCMLNINN